MVFLSGVVNKTKKLIQYNYTGCRGERGSLCERVEGEILFWQGGVEGEKKCKMHGDFKNTWWFAHILDKHEKFWQGGDTGDVSYKKHMVIGELVDHLQIQKTTMIIFHDNCRKQKCIYFYKKSIRNPLEAIDDHQKSMTITRNAWKSCKTIFKEEASRAGFITGPGAGAQLWKV